MYVIIGGNSGIGKALSLELANQGQEVLIIGRQLNLLNEVASLSNHIQTFKVDIGYFSNRMRLIKYLKHLPDIKAIIHSAGIIQPIKAMKHLSLDDLDSFYKINFLAPFHITQLLLPKLLNARILFLESHLASEPIKGLSAYCMSKSALSMAIKCFKIEHPNIPIASAFPGVVNTNMINHVIHAHDVNPQFSQSLIEYKNSQQLVEPQTAALFLCWLLLKVDSKLYASKEWSIYDKIYHPHWLGDSNQISPID